MFVAQQNRITFMGQRLQKPSQFVFSVMLFALALLLAGAALVIFQIAAAHGHGMTKLDRWALISLSVGAVCSAGVGIWRSRSGRIQ